MIYDLIYTFTKGPWVIQPYVQYTDVPTNLKAGIPQGASTWGGAILASRILKKGFSLTGRWEYISQQRQPAPRIPPTCCTAPAARRGRSL